EWSWKQKSEGLDTIRCDSSFPWHKSPWRYYACDDPEKHTDTRNDGVCEGESKDANENTMLGSFILHDIPAAPKGQQKVKVCFKIDASGILSVSLVR
ncbi:heat shock cognate 70 kDa protein-like protein, partial [Tanacetum coccineum]